MVGLGEGARQASPVVVKAEAAGRVEADGGVRVNVVPAAERLVLDAVDRRHAESRRVFHLLQSNDTR